ncbi:MAG TPA: hypothetical protein VFO69_13130 [Allosphingosinicella sp.]|nr:hypothetical protein [Allosphingosinicella sp.]
MRTEIWTAGLSWLILCAAHPVVAFIPAAPDLAEPAEAYRRIWETDGSRIVRSMEEIVGVEYPASAIEVIISKGRPMTAFDGRTIRLRAGYSPNYMKATMVHELGHRLAFTLRRLPGLDDHELLYLFLYDVWTDLYGQPFADRMARIERRIGPSYAAAWDFALGLSRDERQALLRTLRTPGEGAVPEAPR